MNNLVNALHEAITLAKTPPSDPSQTAVLLRIYDNSTFEIIKRCWPNVTYSKFELSSNERDYYDLVVTENDYPAKAWPFGLLDFCARYAIHVSDMEVRDWYGKLRPAKWECHSEVEGAILDAKFAKIIHEVENA